MKDEPVLSALTLALDVNCVTSLWIHADVVIIVTD